jgi:hypothetical protein
MSAIPFWKRRPGRFGLRALNQERELESSSLQYVDNPPKNGPGRPERNNDEPGVEIPRQATRFSCVEMAKR